MGRRLKSGKMTEIELPVHTILTKLAKQNGSSIYFLVNMILIQKLEEKGYAIDRSELNKVFND